MNKKSVLDKLLKVKDKYIKDGVDIIGIFGSFAKDTNTKTSDIDIAYSLNKELFFKKYSGFASASRITDIKDELSQLFNKNVDFISLENSNTLLIQEIKRDMSYV